MKRLSLFLVLVLMCSMVGTVQAQDEKTKGASAQAQEKASDQAVFHRASDWFATVGKSDEEKQKILAERRAKRAAEKAQKEMQKAEKKMQQKTKELKNKLK